MNNKVLNKQGFRPDAQSKTQKTSIWSKSSNIKRS